MQQYLAKKQNDIMECSKNYTPLMTDPTGKEFSRQILDPLYATLKTKFCNPNSAVQYIQNIIDLPDSVNNAKDTLYTINDNLTNESIILRRKINSFGGVIIGLLISCFLVLYIKLRKIK